MKLKFKILILGIFLLINFLGMAKNSFFQKIKSEIKLKNDIEYKFKDIKVFNGEREEYYKVVPGKYQISLYELKYPESIMDKNNFYNELDWVISNSKIGDKYSVLLERRFYDDMNKLKSDELSQEEKLLELPASSLEENQIEELIKLSKDINLRQYEGTDQEYLNRQIYVLSILLNKKEFDSENVYSELDKEMLITELKNKRKKIISNFEKSRFEYFVKEDYENIEFDTKKNDIINEFDRDIVVSNNIGEQGILPEIQGNVYLKNVPIELVKNLEKNKIKLKRKILLLENSRFHGYTYNENNVIVFLKGKNPSYYYKDYEIDIIVKNIDIINLLNQKTDYYISDFFN